jgi:hypothetical protein
MNDGYCLLRNVCRMQAINITLTADNFNHLPAIMQISLWLNAVPLSTTVDVGAILPMQFKWNTASNLPSIFHIIVPKEQLDAFFLIIRMI